MTAKEYLKQYEEYDRRAKRYQAEYEREAELIDAIRSPSGSDGMPHGNGISRTTEDKAIRLSEKRMRWVSAELDAIEKRQEIFETVQKVSGIEGDILYERYVNLHKWEEVCVLVHMSWHGTHQAHRRALMIVEEIRANNRAL